MPVKYDKNNHQKYNFMEGENTPPILFIVGFWKYVYFIEITMHKNNFIVNRYLHGIRKVDPCVSIFWESSAYKRLKTIVFNSPFEKIS